MPTRSLSQHAWHRQDTRGMGLTANSLALHHRASSPLAGDSPHFSPAGVPVGARAAQVTADQKHHPPYAQPHVLAAAHPHCPKVSGLLPSAKILV